MTTFCGVCVFGMGRSGTSAITGLFAAAGYHVGAEDDLLPANEGNPAGYYENRNTMVLNDAILAELGGTWFSPPSEQTLAEARAHHLPALQEIFDELLTEGDGAPLAIKDPRLQVMLPLWGPVIGERMHPVMVIRDPLEIARSLAARDGTPIVFSLASWELSMTRLLRWLGQRPVTVSPYAQVLGSPSAARAVVEQATAQLDPGYAARVQPTDGRQWLRPDLHRNRAASEEEHAQFLTMRQAALWAWLSGLDVRTVPLEVPPALLIEPAAAVETAGHEPARLQTALELQAREHELGGVREELTRADARGAELAEQGRALSEREAALRIELAAAQAHAEAVGRRVQDAEVAAAHAALQRDDLRVQLDGLLRSRSLRLASAARRVVGRPRRRPG